LASSIRSAPRRIARVLRSQNIIKGDLFSFSSLLLSLHMAQTKISGHLLYIHHRVSFLRKRRRGLP
jgi:hypothetical protein